MGHITEMVERYQHAKTEEERLAAGEEIIREILPELSAFARKITNSEMAKDICQIAFLAIIQGLDGYNGESDQKFRSWCYRILRNKFSDELKLKYKEAIEDIDEASLREIIAAGTKEIPPGVMHDLDFALNLLSAKNENCRLVLWMHYILQWTVNEIAEFFQREYDSVRMQLHRCLELAESLVQKQN